jgi:hypothetical protein
MKCALERNDAIMAYFTIAHIIDVDIDDSLSTASGLSPLADIYRQ